MGEWNIDPYKSVGPIELGRSREEIRAALGQPSKSFRKTRESERLTDEWREMGLFVFYRAPDNCCAIEFAGPASPTLNGQSMLGEPFSEVNRWLREADRGLVLDDAGATSFQFGVGIYAPSREKSPDEPVEAVIVFERGYYDS